MFIKSFVHLCLLFSLTPTRLFSAAPISAHPSVTKKLSLRQLFKRFLPETSHNKKERYYHFLKHVSHALKRPEIWNDLQNLLLILMQFEQFANQEVGSRRYEEILSQIIEKRIHFLLSEQQVSELTDILAPKPGDL
ncbi:hypothetical protein FTN73_04480 [Chlamydia trachomatis]|uniref:Uncharacterized protein n=1 Tax=Chlamydia trachomatis serovar D (strain ATCC VR-885 / DSM 19411 / UW-3/Cx) TaxID=272561 RepID=O84556_CHLTR|nr:hypothetical protein [Chlamydia trachomatis]NP_220067.1 hypothetical protein CT_552 [Chlamydia trachomatis D/UW-3/CX]AAC68154.1 hypothetical protein CT_552 [Chlamydia trachomatis D/UW-3/CX]ADH18260.1 hypothetical protein G9768_02895 [Chlamydia trachomatis G/9768]ADH19184.1 hypothetical protein G11222_02905 [Chlamydia trachomatis G/11222]ADH20108.1 hypothetical protein G11074_02900 [Chlamydia trachomatis G/11074]ADH97205.1 hypothetical protein CTG9301_02905 [Chlamydia trachomatis G/9301]